MPGIDESKCILVTGATAGIGRALALSLAKLPSKPQVIAAGRRQDRLEELKKAGLETIVLDLDAEASSLTKSMDLILEKYPGLDAVVLNAGVQYEFDFKKNVDIAKLRSEININYTSVVTAIACLMPHFVKLAVMWLLECGQTLCAHYFLKAASRPCFVIPVTAGLGIVPAVWAPGYSASKAALHSFTTTLRAQLRDTNIHVIEIIPPLVESELHDAEGTTEKLRKVWMPLDKYVEVTMQGLRSGNAVISTGASLDWYDKYDAGKESLMVQMQTVREK